jgi:hypothetical protein
MMSARVRFTTFIVSGLLAASAWGGKASAQPAVPPAEAPPPAEDTPPPAALPPEPPSPPAGELPPPVAPPPSMSPAVPSPPSPDAMPPVPPPTAAAAPAWPVAVAPLKVENPSASIRFGVLAQPQFDWVGSPTINGHSQNIYLRRIRVLIGGTLFKDIEYFFDTDVPNFYKDLAADGTKNNPGINIQDAFFTYKPLADYLKFDVGFMLPPLAHNAVQGAGTLYGWDYFANTFRHTNVFGSTVDPVGRDLGIEARGLVLQGHLEYRIGLFQGKRYAAVPAPDPEPPARNSFRYTARVQINLLDPETSFFYAGTYLGLKRILSFGGSFDYQHSTGTSYRYWAADGILDLPLGPGELTAQANFAHWFGGDVIQTTPTALLPSQEAIMGEVGYRFAVLRLNPIFRFEHRWQTGNDETRYVGGLAFWLYGHNSNLKVFYSRVLPSGIPADHDFSQFNAQWQVYYF